MDVMVSILSLILGILGTYFAYLQVREQFRKKSAPSPVLVQGVDGNAQQQKDSSPNESDSESLRVVTTHHLRKKGWSIERIIDALIKMDYDTLDGAAESDVGTTLSWKPVVEANPDGMRLVVNSNEEIVAYWHFLPLDDEHYEKAKKGELDDGSIRIDALDILGPPGEYNMYFTIIAIVPSYRGIRALRLLLDAFAENLLQMAKRDIFFPEICATAFTPEGDAMCKTLKMKLLTKHHAHGKVYWLNLRTCPNNVFYHPELHRLYSTKYLCQPLANNTNGVLQEVT